MTDFRKEAEEYMREFGYTLHSYNPEETSLTFTADKEHYPGITCTLVHGDKYMQLSDMGSYKMFLTLSSGNLSFKHKDLHKYIDVFIYYSKLAQFYKPW